MDSKFDRICKDFDRRRPSEAPAKRIFWFEAKWENERDSVNDLLRRFLIDNAMEYLKTFNGDVWFIRDGNWCRCDYAVNGDTVRFYLCEFTGTGTMNEIEDRLKEYLCLKGGKEDGGNNNNEDRSLVKPPQKNSAIVWVSST